MPTLVLTGASRGLGLEFARQYAQDGWQVHAACRNPQGSAIAELAKAHPNITLHALDVTDFGRMKALAQELSSLAIDLLLNNAGIYGKKEVQNFGALDENEWLSVFRVNTVAPIKMTEAFLPLVQKSEGKTIAAVSSEMGSIGDNAMGGAMLYRTSKAALNMALKNLSLELAAQGIKVLTLHPGWVRTDMGGQEASLSPDESVRGMRKVIAQSTMADSGRFLAWDGRALPW